MPVALGQTHARRQLRGASLPHCERTSIEAKAAQLHLPGHGFVLAAMVGLTDVDAITLSMGDCARSHEMRVAVTSIVIGTISNRVVKCGMVPVLSGGGLRLTMLLATAAVLAVGIVALVLVPLCPSASLPRSRK
jgi:uncharacterized membrane protein (DUF4010 family)